MKKKTILLFVLAGMIIASAGIYQHPKARWRVDLCISKILGGLPDVAWEDLAAATLPRRIAARLELSALSVNAIRQGEDPCSVLWRTRRGSFWGRINDKGSLQVALKNLLVEEACFGDCGAIRPGDIVLDGGSHIGTFTRFALDQKASMVVGFEPEPVNAACYRKTFMQEIKEGRVILIEKALWDKAGRIAFSVGAASVDGRVRQSDMSPGSRLNEMEIPATTVDEEVQRLKLERINFIKLHIEGSERQALMGAKNTVVRFKPRILISLDHRPDDPEIIPRMILDIVPGYQIEMRGRNQACFFMK